MHLQIRRNQVFEDSYQQLRDRSASDMRGRLQIQFYGEQGIDAGGLTREWFSILAREIFNPGYALFMAAVDGATFQPNPLSFINSNHLDYFKFVGRIIGKAICDGQLMDAHFTRSFYKHLLGMPIEFNDIEATEPDYYKSLKMMLGHPLEDLGFTGMTFTAEIQKFGRTEDVELIPNGAQIMVTDDNKHDYVRLIAHHRMTAGIFPQIDSFLAGFYELVPPELICIFSPTELELLICGLPDVNIDELQMHTEYHQYRSTDPAIQWFWEALRSFNREERALFLQFVTGTSKVPLGGFAHLQGMRGSQKFTIHKLIRSESGTLPCAHTCYNQLDLPEYSTAEEMREKLLLAITEGSEGFGFA
jgi:E3 ubiquitin-protein ligase HUWE1